MQKIDKYCCEVYYITSTITDPTTPDSLSATLRTDLFKMMGIGSILGVTLRFCISKRFYLFKNYLASSLWGGILGVVYSPFFLGPKIDEYKLLKYIQSKAE